MTILNHAIFTSERHVKLKAASCHKKQLLLASPIQQQLYCAFYDCQVSSGVYHVGVASLLESGFWHCCCNVASLLGCGIVIGVQGLRWGVALLLGCAVIVGEWRHHFL